jgi:hypothetical protein
VQEPSSPTFSHLIDESSLIELHDLAHARRMLDLDAEGADPDQPLEI